VVVPVTKTDEIVWRCRDAVGVVGRVLRALRPVVGLGPDLFPGHRVVSDRDEVEIRRRGRHASRDEHLRPITADRESSGARVGNGGVPRLLTRCCVVRDGHDDWVSQQRMTSGEDRRTVLARCREHGVPVDGIRVLRLPQEIPRGRPCGRRQRQHGQRCENDRAPRDRMILVNASKQRLHVCHPLNGSAERRMTNDLDPSMGLLAVCSTAEG
jgi:hypothetical protein